jgi:nucleoside-diphosphate-sugar epimerase
LKERVILTGATGFVGKNLITYLLANFHHILTISRAQLNVIELKHLDGIDTIIHLAGKAHDLKKISNSDDYYKANYELTKDLYNAFLKSNARKFIFISSVKAAADVVDGVLTETFVPNPQTHYGKSKLMAEEYIQSQFLPAGKYYYILRPCMIHGPGNKGNLNLLYQFVRMGVPYPLASFENKRSFLSITNLCFVINELLNQIEVPSGVYNISDDEALSTNEVVSSLAENLGRKPKLWHIPKSFIYVLVKIGDKLKLPLNTERLNKLTENYVVSNEKVKKVLKIKMPVTARLGLKVTADSFNLK